MSANSLVKKIVALFSSAILFVTVLSVAVSAENNSQELNADIDLQIEQTQPYLDYLNKYSSIKYGKETIVIDVVNGYSAEHGVMVVDNIGDNSGECLQTDEEGYVEWNFEVTAEGLYEMWVEYYPIEGKGSSIVRSIHIDGTLPFEEARNVNFGRIWVDTEKRSDKSGNEIKPVQKQAPEWITAPVKDSVGYVQENLKFYLSKGTHTLRFTALREPMVIKNIYFKNPQEKVLSYKDVQETYNSKGYTSPNADIIYIEAENTKAKSDASIIPASDRSSAEVSPSHYSKIRLNTIGSGKWSQNGQWIEWSVKVEKSGLYKIALKEKQDGSSGANTYRKILIDGALPFRELESVSFPYSIRWGMTELGNDDGAYKFYFEGGKTYTLRMEVILGDDGKDIQEIEDVVNKLNIAYRDILIVTGTNPDVNRDYNFDEILPETIDSLKEQLKRLKTTRDNINERIGEESEYVQPIEKMIRQIEAMTKKPDTIAKKFNQFQTDITSLATWINSAKSQPLSLDYIVVAPYDEKIPSKNVNFFEGLIYHIKSFFATFVEDYSGIDKSTSDSAVTVWVGNGNTGGRDQAQVLKNMADNEFTSKTGIPVNIQLISMGALLPSTLSGIGPDVALTLGQSDPVNYAVRNAVVDLTQFEDYKEVVSRFSPGAMVPLSFNGGVYALPESETFPMMFYRKDILTELGLKIPDTWEDVVIMLPYLQKKQFNFGLPTVATGIMPMYSMLLLQNGGELYSEGGKESKIDSLESIDSMILYTRFYTDYQIPQTIDFINRFRSGEVPIGIADYSMYNQLSVFAPELDGLWGFAPVPGVKQEDGTINRTTASTVAACIILKNSDKQKDAWEFLKWWTSAETQTDFGLELESILGTSARYATANLEAMKQLPWDSDAYAQISKQWKYAKGLPEVPGGYYTSRYIGFAFTDAVNQSLEPSDLLIKYKKVIDEEIKSKRKEFKLED